MDIISNLYKNQLRLMQQNNKFKEGLTEYPAVYNFVKDQNPNSIIDFGCASGKLISKLREDFPHINTIDGYDPGVEEFENVKGTSYDCLISNDVVEHIEPEFLNDTLVCMDSLFTKSAWLIIACYPAKKILADGRNAHLTVKEPTWWLTKIAECFSKSTIDTSRIVECGLNKLELHLILKK